jgi:hypothetical protein
MKKMSGALLVLSVGLAACSSRPPDMASGDRGEGATAALQDWAQPIGHIGLDDCGANKDAKIAFMDSDLFDDNITWLSRRGYGPITVIGFDNRRPEDIPPRLMRWMWELKQHGGNVSTKTEYEGFAQRNFIIGWVLDIVAGSVQTAQKYGGLYNYDAEVVAVQKIVDDQPVRTLKEVRLICRKERPQPAKASAAPVQNPKPEPPVLTEPPTSEPAAAPKLP